jgi:AraC-like DNA-binding protein
MDRISNRLYAFKSISRFSCSRIQLEQRISTRFGWMLIIIAGTGAVITDHQRYAMTSGSALLGQSGSLVLQAERYDEESIFLFIEFMDVPFPDFSDEGKQAGEESHWAEEKNAPHANELVTLAERLFSVMNMNAESLQRSLTSHMLIQQMMLWWLSYDHEEHSQQQTTDQSVLATVHYMEAHFTDTLTREQLAGIAGIASTYFSVLCKRLTGVSPSDYLERLRVHRAAELLLQGRENKGDLAEVSNHSGFRDPWYMSKRFRKLQGMSPTVYRSHFTPERVASLEYPYTYHLMALGILPCAARFSNYNEVIQPPTHEAIVELPSLMSIESQKQLLIKSKPQVIITYDMENVREKLRWIAPVVYIPWISMNWREHLRAIGRLFLREAEAVRCMEALDRQAEQVRQQIYNWIAPGTRVSVFKIENKHCYLYGIRDTGCIFYEFLGLCPHPHIQQRIARDPNFHSMEISIKQMTEYAGELNFVILSPDSSEQSDYLRMNEHWRQFEIANKHPVIYLDYREWLHYDPINIAAQLQKIKVLLAGFMQVS